MNPTATPQFVNTPGQVAFSPDGSKLIVTTKANGNDIDVFNVGLLGYLSPNPVVNAEPGTVPFAIGFDQAGNLVIAEAGTNSLATFALNHDGTVTLLHSVATGQAATCWVASAGSFFYASNAGSASVTGFRSGPGGQLTALGNTSTDAGTVDAAASSDGRFLYVQAGGPGNVDAFRINSDGSLTALGSSPCRAQPAAKASSRSSLETREPGSALPNQVQRLWELRRARSASSSATRSGCEKNGE